MQSRVARPARQVGITTAKDESQQRAGPTNIKTFFRCLRLLDLDQLSDWPGITEDVLTSRSAQQSLQPRTKAVEWSLYRLFEIYDPKETQTKLRPFFPPLAPLQSLNLRAALYRALTELKKNGILGRDVVLRKTMLDECKGDKFEEVMSAFGLLVLKKVARSQYPELVKQVESLPEEHLVPLILAHKHGLQGNLRKRQVISERAALFAGRLAAEEAELQQRELEAEQNFPIVDEDHLRQVSESVRNTWIGDDRWCDILLEGSVVSEKSILAESFEAMWEASNDKRTESDPPSQDLLTDLDERVNQQRDRLNKWKTFHASLLNAQASNSGVVQQGKSTTPKRIFQFDKHQELRIASQSHSRPAKELLQPFHASVFKNMKEELSALRSSPGTLDTASSRADTSSGVQQQQEQNKVSNCWEESHNRSTITVSDNSRKNQSRHTNSNILEGAVIEETAPIPPTPVQFASSPPRILFEDDDFTTNVSAEVDSNEMATVSPHVKATTKPTLTERTRFSLLPLIDDKSVLNTTINPMEKEENEEHDSPALPAIAELSTRAGTLLERTRQSMLLMPHTSSTSKPARRSTRQPRFSEAFPVNQFETPGKPRTSQHRTISPGSGASTPREKLFSEEADYASVFKSRPRIALSPSLSPERIDVGSQSMNNHGVQRWTLEDEDVTPSRNPIK